MTELNSRDWSEKAHILKFHTLKHSLATDFTQKKCVDVLLSKNQALLDYCTHCNISKSKHCRYFFDKFISVFIKSLEKGLSLSNVHYSNGYVFKWAVHFSTLAVKL